MTAYGDERLPTRFWEKCVPEPTTGCWLWTGYVNGDGYGRSSHRSSRSRFAHRIAYEILVGPVPDGLELDHTRCDTRCCVNPAHLRPVTHTANVVRSERAMAALAAGRPFAAEWRRRKTHCPHGHPCAGDNLLVRGGRRYCRSCCRLSGRRKKVA